MSRDFDHFFLFCTQYVAVHSEPPPKYGDFIEMKPGGIRDSVDGLCGIMTGNKMNMQNSCVCCVLNQMLRVSGYLACSREVTDRVFGLALKKISRMDYPTMTAPECAEHIYAIFSQVTGDPDPYKRLRKEQNMMIMDRIGFFRDKIKHSDDPLFSSLLYSLMGNMIDYGGEDLVDDIDVFKQYDSLRLTVNDYPLFRERLLKGNQILILADNAGEAVLDLLFLEQMKKFNPRATYHYGVRSKPAINDVLIDDARFIGIDQYAHLLETGSTFAGTRLSRSSPEFREIYHEADLVISKGQGNFETLEAESDDILFSFKVKCEVVAAYTGLKKGDLVFGFRSSIFRS
jgi:uncharacterized protein with ATP-grasp and redox domains